jgi:hypothetical protein
VIRKSKQPIIQLSGISRLMMRTIYFLVTTAYCLSSSVYRAAFLMHKYRISSISSMSSYGTLRYTVLPSKFSSRMRYMSILCSHERRLAKKLLRSARYFTDRCYSANCMGGGPFFVEELFLEEVGLVTIGITLLIGYDG